MPITDRTTGRVHYVVQEAPPSAETIERFEGMVAAMRRFAPQMLEAKQPPPLPQGLNDPVSSPALRERFHKTVTERVANNSYRLRVPAVSLDGMIELQGRGDCIAPAQCHGDISWIDPHTEPQEGDIVSILLHPASAQYNLNWRLKHPEVVAIYGTQASLHISKVLMAVGSTWYGVAANGSCYELGERTGNRVLGVTRRIARHGVVTYTDGSKKEAWVRIFEEGSLPTYIPPAPHMLVPGITTAHAVAGPPIGPVAGRPLPFSDVEESTNPANLTLGVTNPGTEESERDFITFTPEADCHCTVRVNYKGQIVNTGGGSGSGISGWGAAFISESSDPDGTRQIGQEIDHTFDSMPITVEATFELTKDVEYRAGLFLHVETSTSDAQIAARQLTITVTRLYK